MPRPAMSVDRRRHAMIQACQRAISRGERPLFRVAVAQDGRWEVEGTPWLLGLASSRGEALAAARAALAAMLEVEPDAFEVAAN